MAKIYDLSLLVFLVALSLIIGLTACSGDKAEEAPESKILVPENDSKARMPDIETSPDKKVEEAPPAETEPPQVSSKTQGLQAEFFILSPLWKTYKKGRVRFTHENHAGTYKIGCVECHHVYNNGENVWKEGAPVKKCEECHDEPTVKGEKKLSDELQKRNLKLMFHNNCRGCHKKLKKENPNTKAPTTCGKCHEKKKR